MWHSQLCRLCTALLLAVPAPVIACKCSLKTTDQRVAAANHIFIARVTEARTIHVSDAPTASQQQVEARFQRVRVIKGSPPVEGVVRGDVYNGGANCAFPLTPGTEYVFFFAEQVFLSGCNGSREFFPWQPKHQAYIREIEKIVEVR